MGLFKHKINKLEVLKWGILGGAAEAVYLFMVIMLFFAMDGKGNKTSPVMGIVMMIIMVVSVMISVVLVGGKPLSLVVKKRIREAGFIFLTTLVTLIVILAILLAVSY